MTEYARHRPDSHPLVQQQNARMRKVVQQNAAAVRNMLAEAESDWQRVTDTLEHMGRLVASLPDIPFTTDQRTMAGVLGKELHRRSRREATRDNFYTHPRSDETRKKYDAIAAMVKDNPTMTLAEIATHFGCSNSLVSKVSIVRGVRRRIRRAA